MSDTGGQTGKRGRLPYNSVGGTIASMSEEKATRGASRYDAIIATLVGFLALCVSGYTAYMHRYSQCEMFLILSCRKKRRSLRKAARIGTAIQAPVDFVGEMLNV